MKIENTAANGELTLAFSPITLKIFMVLSAKTHKHKSLGNSTIVLPNMDSHENLSESDTQPKVGF